MTLITPSWERGKRFFFVRTCSNHFSPGGSSHASCRDRPLTDRWNTPWLLYRQQQRLHWLVGWLVRAAPSAGSTKNEKPFATPGWLFGLQGGSLLVRGLAQAQICCLDKQQCRSFGDILSGHGPGLFGFGVTPQDGRTQSHPSMVYSQPSSR